MERAVPSAQIVSEFKKIEFVPSGSHMLDLVLGGGWAQGRIINIVGDRSAGKSMLAVEACANFAQSVGGIGSIRYLEAESAFDESYADVIGMPKGLTPIGGIDTVEGFYADLESFLASTKGPKLYILDSLDALSDAAEIDRDLDKGSFGATKAKMLSQLFRRLVRKIEEANCALIIVSQVRDNIGVTFGEKNTRSGGRALDFYASQILWLARKKQIPKTVLGVSRTIGIEIRAHTKKNKVGVPFREVDLTMLFNYGIDDEASILAWLGDNKVETGDLGKELNKARKAQDRDAVRQIAVELKGLATDRWNEIEESLRPPMRKYGA